MLKQDLNGFRLDIIQNKGTSIKRGIKGAVSHEWRILKLQKRNSDVQIQSLLSQNKAHIGGTPLSYLDHLSVT